MVKDNMLEEFKRIFPNYSNHDSVIGYNFYATSEIQLRIINNKICLCIDHYRLSRVFCINKRFNLQKTKELFEVLRTKW